jgi:glycosyltransferase involved in cell wall biosynthesis
MQTGPEERAGSLRALCAGVNLAPQGGGIFRTVLAFYKALESKDWAVEIVNFSKYEAMGLPEETMTFPTTRVPVGRAYQWSRHVRDEAVESAIGCANLVILHGIYVHPLLRVAQIAKKRGIPYILVPHGSLDPFSLRRHRWQKRAWLSLYGETLFARSAAVLYGSEIEKNRSVVSGTEGRAECLPWAVEVGSAEGDENARQRVRLRYSLARDRRIALFCARVAKVKRLPETIRAFLREAPRDWVLLCVGPRSSDVDIEEIRTLCTGSEGRCLYVGPVFGHDLEDYYAAADLFVLLSYSENFGHSCAEALARGVPVALSPGVGLAARVHRHGGGFVADGESFDDMCRVLAAAFNCSAGALREVGEVGRKWVERELSPGAFAVGLDALCRSVCGGTQSAAARCAEAVTASAN